LRGPWPSLQKLLKRSGIDVKVARNDVANTLRALDDSGLFLSDVNSVFGALQGADTNPAIQEIAKEVTPLMSAHGDNIRLNEKLFARVKGVYDQRDRLKLSPEERFLLENTYREFVRGGALLDDKQKARLRELNRELALLSLRFGDNLLAETNDFKLVIDNRDDLAGLPASVVAMAEETARQLRMPGKWIFTVQVPSMTPFLQYSTNRALREKMHRAYFMRGDQQNSRDNKEIVRGIANLRSERAKLLGYASHADYVLEANMARTPAAVDRFLLRLWEPSLPRARKEVTEMQAIIDREGGGFKLASWDWWHYAEKLRQEKYALDDAALRPYFRLDSVREGIFTLCDRALRPEIRRAPRRPRLPSRGPGLRGARSRRAASGRTLYGFPSPAGQAQRRLVRLVPTCIPRLAACVRRSRLNR